MNDFEQWLSNEFATAAHSAPLQSPLPSQAKYQRANWWSLSVLPALRSLGRGMAFAAAMLFGLAAVTTHSLNPATVAQQSVASIGACAGDLGHGAFGSCLGEFTTPQLNKTPNNVIPPPHDQITPGPYVTPEPAPTPTPTPSETPQPIHATPTPAPKITPPPSPHPTSPPPTGSTLFTDNFQSYSLGSTPPYGQGSSDTVMQDGTKNYLNAGEARISISQSGWNVTDVKGLIREHGSIAAALGDTDGTTSFFCGVSGGQLQLTEQTPSGYTTLGAVPYTVDVSVTWAGLHLQTANGQATCSTMDGATTGSVAISSGYHANAAILQSRISVLGQTNDFDDIYIEGSRS